MNSPVTHAECQKCREELEKKFHECIKEEKMDFREAVEDIEEWVLRLEDKIGEINRGIDNIVKEVAVGMFLLFVTFLWGKL